MNDSTKLTLTLSQLRKLVSEAKQVNERQIDEVIFGDDMFDLVKKSGIGMDDIHWEGLEVISKGLARKHVIEVRLNTTNHMIGLDDGGSKEFKYEYSDAYVAHGMRMRTDTLDETRECIEALQHAVEFAEKVNAYLKSHN